MRPAIGITIGKPRRFLFLNRWCVEIRAVDGTLIDISYCFFFRRSARNQARSINHHAQGFVDALRLVLTEDQIQRLPDDHLYRAQARRVRRGKR